MSEEWGPWVEHDGMGTPVPNGTYVHAVCNNGYVMFGFVSTNGIDPLENVWYWINGEQNVIRYRVRKPKGLQILEALLQGLPETVDA